MQLHRHLEMYNSFDVQKKQLLYIIKKQNEGLYINKQMQQLKSKFIFSINSMIISHLALIPWIQANLATTYKQVNNTTFHVDSLETIWLIYTAFFTKTTIWVCRMDMDMPFSSQTDFDKIAWNPVVNWWASVTHVIFQGLSNIYAISLQILVLLYGSWQDGRVKMQPHNIRSHKRRPRTG